MATWPQEGAAQGQELPHLGSPGVRAYGCIKEIPAVPSPDAGILAAILSDHRLPDTPSKCKRQKVT